MPNRSLKPRTDVMPYRGGWLLALALFPTLALDGIIAVSVGPQPMLGVMVIAVAFHAVLLAFVPLRREGDGMAVCVISALGFCALAFGLPVLQAVLPSGGGAPRAILPLLAGWGGGFILAFGLVALGRGRPELGEQSGSWVAKVIATLIGAGVLGSALWLVAAMPDLFEGRLPPWRLAAAAALLSLVPLMVVAPARRALALVRRRPSALTALVPIGAVVLAGLALAGFGLVPDPAPLGPGSALALLGLTGALILVLAGAPLGDFAAVLLLLGLVPALVPQAMDSDPVTFGMIAILHLLFLSAMLLPVRDRAHRLGRGRRPPDAELFGALQERLGTFILQLDFEGQTVRFPFGGGAPFGAAEEMSLNEFLRLAPVKGVLDLMQKLQRGESPSGLSIRFRLRRRTVAEGQPDWVTEPFAVHGIENRYPFCWIALVRDSLETDRLAEQAERFERLLTLALHREERLLMIVGQDLHAPANALRDMASELRAGASWSEVGQAFDTGLDLLLDTLGELNSGNALTEGGIATGRFTLRRIADRLEAAFVPLARERGMSLHLSLPRQADTPLAADHGRIFVALSRLLRNAIDHSGATDIAISAFVTAGNARDVQVTWHVSDNGGGIEPRLRNDLFDPLAPVGLRPGAKAGLGLFAARRALRQIGGDLVLHGESSGTHLALSHPAVMIAGEPELEPERAAPLLSCSALLVASEAETSGLPVATLERICARVATVRNLSEARASLRRDQPDIIFVGHTSPEMPQAATLDALVGEGLAVPLIALLPVGDVEAAETLGQCHAARVLKVPVDVQSLRRLILQLVADRSAPADVRRSAAG